jgi:hypothetical protein
LPERALCAADYQTFSISPAIRGNKGVVVMLLLWLVVVLVLVAGGRWWWW